MDDVIDRLSRRGELAVTAHVGSVTVALSCPRAFGAGWATADAADLFEHCRFGAPDWHGEGDDLATLLAECLAATEPPRHDVEDIRWRVEHRRATRTCGPPLPTYSHRSWRPGVGRWLRTSHASEYLAGYLRDVAEASGRPVYGGQNSG